MSLSLSGHISWAEWPRELLHPHPLTARMKANPRTLGTRQNRIQTHPSPRPEGRTLEQRAPAALAPLHTFACDLHVINFTFKACPSARAGGPSRTSSWVRPGSPRPPRRPSRAAARLAEDPSPLRPLIDGAALCVNPPLIPRKL